MTSPPPDAADKVPLADCENTTRTCDGQNVAWVSVSQFAPAAMSKSATRWPTPSAKFAWPAFCASASRAVGSSSSAAVLGIRAVVQQQAQDVRDFPRFPMSVFAAENDGAQHFAVADVVVEVAVGGFGDDGHQGAESERGRLHMESDELDSVGAAVKAGRVNFRRARQLGQHRQAQRGRLGLQLIAAGQQSASGDILKKIPAPRLLVCGAVVVRRAGCCSGVNVRVRAAGDEKPDHRGD